MKYNPFVKRLLKFFYISFSVLGLLLLVIPVGYVLAVNNPDLWYSLNPQALDADYSTVAEDPFIEGISLPKSNGFISNQQSNSLVSTLPAINPTIASGRRLIIPSIGINTALNEGTNEYAALEKGVWVMPKHGVPTDTTEPTVLAAHRWGNIRLSRAYRQQHLFYNLPQLAVGAEIIIQWDQREFKYIVRHKEQTNHVTQLNDLILITCQYVNSPVRLIVYAERQF